MRLVFLWMGLAACAPKPTVVHDDECSVGDTVVPDDCGWFWTETGDTDAPVDRDDTDVHDTHVYDTDTHDTFDSGDMCDHPDTGMVWRLAAEDFRTSFGTLWCQRWSDCGHAGDCADVEPSLSHYENNLGYLELDCQPAGCSTEWDFCLDLVSTATCDEVLDAGQYDETNGPLSLICMIWSCV